VAAAEKIPLNPYYMIVWYVLFLFGVATVAINLSAQSLASIYHLCQWLGLENALLLINRPYRIHEFLLARDNADRWQRIAVYYSTILVTLPLFLWLSIAITPKYLKYIATIVPSWSQPFDQKTIRAMRIVLWYGIFMVLGTSLTFCFARSDLGQIPRVSPAIQLLNTSYYSEAIKVGMFCFGVAALQFRARRIANNRALAAQRKEYLNLNTSAH